ncbi:dephospho-CoA kinase [Ornithinimicrobium cryptoxanthini]|uniref:Dephospho-CoA kinase n=1 Tax=Ornithinimicrobium cryptoxanthini TaxID=2934161 RepID=A0ABY4YDT0_9MICO|nr:dephospho-CoA kinase [Ornithinimicrobium cryptoxanthini]USQ74936.1 dephospho-CoA kinase [Ornithinimicrobium cryptoxanthini]
MPHTVDAAHRLWIGLSGGIGSGKSTVSSALARHGVVVIDADALAREVVEPGARGLEAVAHRFGSGILTPDGALDRPALGRIVFADPAARRELERITHPLIAERTREVVAAAPPSSILVHDVPLLVELGYAPRYHLVVIVGTSRETRLERLVRLRGMDRAEAEQRIDAQASDDARRAVADVWLTNEGSVQELRSVTQGLYAERLAPYLANLEQGRAVAARGVPGPEVLGRLGARLEHVLGDDLAGPPDLDPGTDSLLLMLTAGTPPAAVAERLTEAGFPQVGDGQHAAADPGRPVLLTVREHTVGAGG